MRTKAEWAKLHAQKGFWVFRLAANGKVPKYKGWQMEATRDPDMIDELWKGKDANCNIGAYTSKFKDDLALLVVDVDNKGGKDGDGTMFELDMGNCPFPDTFENRTPTGGRHVVYFAEKAVKQGAEVLGEGLDIRSRGGYIAMAGSTIDGKSYVFKNTPIVKAPDWLYSKLLLATNVAPKMEVDSSKLNPQLARERAVRYLDDAAMPERGQRNDTMFKVACELKDRGVDETVCFELLAEWNESWDEPLDDAEMETTIHSAYASGQNAIGSKAPEVIFDKVEKKKKAGPFDEMNEKFAFTIAGGGHHILWETTDEKGNFKLEHLNEQAFHKMLAHKTIQLADGKRHAISKLWLADADCRRYDGLVFSPGKEVDQRFYNMWRGFAYKPLKAGEPIDPVWKSSLDKFLEHALMNVCNGDEKLFSYLIGYFAQLVQRPWEKPLVALVFKGKKGVGKNAIIERVAALIAPHYIIADDRRYLTGNFNGHLESCLMMVLDEAAWPGDKEGEGRLKGLITGSHHVIEHKGKEPFKVDNLTRTIVLGNEDWLVPATQDERRYAVFNVGDGRKQDRSFFYSMRKGMEDGGYRLLLTYLLEYDISNFDINHAPMTQGLIDQKHASLEPMEQWWLDCLSEGYLVGSAAKGIDFREINTETFRNAFIEYARRRMIRTRLPDERKIGKVLSAIAPSLRKRRTRVGGELAYNYVSDGLAALRRDWELYVGSKIEWPVDEENGDLECLM